MGCALRCNVKLSGQIASLFQLIAPHNFYPRVLISLLSPPPFHELSLLHLSSGALTRVCVRLCVRANVHVCVRGCERACVRLTIHACARPRGRVCMCDACECACVQARAARARRRRRACACSAPWWRGAAAGARWRRPARCSRPSGTRPPRATTTPADS